MKSILSQEEKVKSFMENALVWQGYGIQKKAVDFSMLLTLFQLFLF